MLARVGVRVTTHGKDGVRVERKGAEPGPRARRARPARRRPDRRRRRLPRGLPGRPGAGGSATSGARRSAALLATHVLETVGTQEYRLERGGRAASASPTRTATTPPPRSPRTSRGPCRRDHGRSGGAGRAAASAWRVRPARRRARGGPRRGRGRPAPGHPAARPTAPGSSRWAWDAAAPGPSGWWSPDPRGVLPLDGLRVSRSLRASARRFEVRVDTAFDEVVAGVRRPGPAGRVDHAGGGRRLRRAAPAGLGALGRVLARRASSPGACTASPSAACSPASRCSTASRDASKVALVGLVDAAAGRRRSAPAARRPVAHHAPGLARGGRGAAGGVSGPAAGRAGCLPPALPPGPVGLP